MTNHKRSRWLYILAALPIIAGLLAVTRLLAAPPQATATPAPPTATVPPPVASAATAVSTAAAQEVEQIPPCPFTAAPVVSPAVSLDAYSFSEPQVVMTSTPPILLLQWLPDNRRMLIIRLKEGVVGDYVEVFDPDTGETTRYAERQNGGPAIWLPAEQAVAFMDSAPPDYVRTLYLGRGDGLPAEKLATGLATGLLSLDADGQRILFHTTAQGVQSLNLRQPSVAETLVARTPGQLGTKWGYGDALRADGRMVVMYGGEGFYLIDRVTGATCGMDFGGTGHQKVWAGDVEWSPDGRYMAITTCSGGEVTLVSCVGLVVIDTITGQSRSLAFDRRFVYSLDWAPDSRVFLVVVEAGPTAPSNSFHSLYLVDAASGDSRPILPEHQFPVAGYYTFWSPDGKAIAVPCSDVALPDNAIEWRICTVAVEAQ